MDLLSGLTGKQIGALRHLRGYRELEAGDVIFKEGDRAHSLYSIISGEILIHRSTVHGDVELAKLKDGAVFGEMGLILDTGQRTASAKALAPSLLLEIGGDPIQVFNEMGEPEGGLRMLENLICILAERLQRKDSPANVPINLTSVPTYRGLIPDAHAALQHIEKSLPGGVLGFFSRGKKLAVGETLFSQADPSDSFCFIQEGELRVTKADHPNSPPRELARIKAPAVAGELGFFSGQERSATLIATEPVVYTRFAGSDYKKLRKNDPQAAFGVLMAACQIICCLILDRENG